ncbi:Tau-tubulin kinase 2 [Dinochytrium kinnereticum]|nr:Tau-tubulin kinase 2 [Dinochytrium kinnereticum]
MLTAAFGGQNGFSTTGGTVPQPPPLENVVIKGRWKIIDTVGKGAFGQVYTALDLQTSETVAIKVENPACKKPVLKLEISVLRKLQDSPYFCRNVAAGRFTWPQNLSYSDGPMSPTRSPKMTSPDPLIYSYMVMELLGPSLSELRRNAPHQKFSLATTAILAKQMLWSIEALHRVGFLHRDIKPGNFCMQLTDPSQALFESDRRKCLLIDFGLARRYLSANGKVREARSKVGFRGTARYASINAHLGLELGRVDDLWSLFYLIVEFLTGQLPWKGKEKDLIGELKQQYTSENLCLGFPSLICLHHYLESLTYADKPDYVYIETLIHFLLVQSGDPENVPYDWEGRCDASTIADEMAIEQDPRGDADVPGRYQEEDIYPPNPCVSRNSTAIISSLSVRPTESGIRMEDKRNRRTSLSSATVTVAHAIESAFSPGSPSSSSPFRIPLSPEGPEPKRRFFADEALGRGSARGYGHVDFWGKEAYYGDNEMIVEGDDGVVPDLKVVI